MLNNHWHFIWTLKKETSGSSEISYLSIKLYGATSKKDRIIQEYSALSTWKHKRMAQEIFFIPDGLYRLWSSTKVCWEWFSAIKWRNRESDRSPLSSANIKNCLSYTSSLPTRHMTSMSAISLTFWRRNYFILILAHPVYKMWIIQEPNTLELWKKLHFEEKKRRVYIMFKIFSTYICWINT